MKMSLAVFDAIRERARTAPGTALLMPFDATLFMDYDAAGVEVFCIVDDVRTLILKSTWETFDAATVACIERGWLSKDETMRTMFSVLGKMDTYTESQKQTMRDVVVRWAVLRHMDEVTNG